MKAVVKVGGSLGKNSKSLNGLCKFLSKLRTEHDLVIVPGGGVFADTVRESDHEYHLSSEASHKMAVLAMDQYGILLEELTPISETVLTPEEVELSLSRGNLPILLPSHWLFKEDPLEHSWDVASDSIAVWIAGSLKTEKIILATDVDGIFPENSGVSKGRPLREISRDLLEKMGKTCVDKGIPKVLSKVNAECYVVNGKHPDRIKKILDGKATVCTKIIS